MNEAKQKIHYTALVVIIGIGVVLRLVLLQQPLRFDEAVTFIEYASQSFGYGLTVYSAPNNHIFHTLLVHLTTLGGTQYQEWLIRLPAFLSGIGIIPATYLLGCRLYNTNAGVLAAAVVAASAPLIEYATNARGYSLVTLCFLGMWIVATGLLLQQTRRRWCFFVVLMVVGIYTIPTMVYGVAIVAGWLAISLIVKEGNLQGLGALVIALLIGAGLTLLLYLPVFMVSGVEAVIGNAFVTPLSWEQFSDRILPSLAETLETWNRYAPPVLAFLFLIGAIASLVFHRQSAIFPVPAVLAVLFCAPLVILQQVIPYARVWLFLLPLSAILAAGGWSSLIGRKIKNLAIPSIVICFILSVYLPLGQSANPFDELGVEDNAFEIALYLNEIVLTERRSMALIPPSESIVFYFRKYGVPLTLLPEEFSEIDAELLLLAVPTPEYTLGRFSALLESYGVDFSKYSEPQLLRAFSTTWLYHLERHS